MKNLNSLCVLVTTKILLSVYNADTTNPTTNSGTEVKFSEGLIQDNNEDKGNEANVNAGHVSTNTASNFDRPLRLFEVPLDKDGKILRFELWLGKEKVCNGENIRASICNNVKTNQQLWWDQKQVALLFGSFFPLDTEFVQVIVFFVLLQYFAVPLKKGKANYNFISLFWSHLGSLNCNLSPKIWP